MPTVYRVTAIWNGFTGAPGYSKFSFSDLVDNGTRNAAGAKVQALFEALKSGFQTGWNIAVQPTIDEYDMATGALTGGSSMTTTPTPTVGTATPAAFAGGSGYCVTWNTGLIYNRRRVRGRTFFVPSVNVFETNGTLSSASITLITNAANTFLALTAPRPNVWSRQWSNADPPIQVGGALAPIDSFTLKDMASQLRTRRL